MPSYASLDVKISCEKLTDDIVFASVAKGALMQDSNVLSWFIKPAHESRYPQIVSGGAGVIALPATTARKARVRKRTTTRKLAEKDKV